MKGIKRFFKCMLSDCPDISIKRVVGFLAFLILVAMAVLNIVKLVTPASFIFDGFLYIVLGCFGLNALVDAVKAKGTPAEPAKKGEEE